MVDAGLHGILAPFNDAALLEVHGEQILELFAKKAPEGVWTERLQMSLIAAARADDTGVFFRLFALCGSDSISGRLLASMEGHRDCGVALIKAGAPVAYENRAAGTALSQAVEGGHEGVVSELLAAGAGLGKNGTRALSPAIAAQRMSCGPLEQLLLAGADANAVDSTGRSALHVACCNSNEAAVELLLLHGASLASRSDDGRLPRDVVAMRALSRRQGPFAERIPSIIRCRSSTLTVAETAAANRIHDLLERAGAWHRRGWLVMMRARRRLTTTQLPDDDSLAAKPPPTARAAAPGQDSAAEDDFDGNLYEAVGGMSLADAAPSASTPGGGK
eukprot:g11704.t1